MKNGEHSKLHETKKGSGCRGGAPPRGAGKRAVKRRPAVKRGQARSSSVKPSQTRSVGLGDVAVHLRGAEVGAGGRRLNLSGGPKGNRMGGAGAPTPDCV